MNLTLIYEFKDYWKSIVKLKIEIIRHFGGRNVGRDIYAELSKHPDELEYLLSSVFEYLAQNVIEVCIYNIIFVVKPSIISFIWNCIYA